VVVRTSSCSAGAAAGEAESVVVTRSVLAVFHPDDLGQGKSSELENADFLMRLELVKDESGVCS
jgi:hypothetical protein